MEEYVGGAVGALKGALYAEGPGTGGGCPYCGGS